MNNNSYSFLVAGKSTDKVASQDFKRYIGLANSYVVAVNPTKKELDEIYGRDMNEPNYDVPNSDVKAKRVTFIVKTDPLATNGIEIINKVTFTLQGTPDYNKDHTSVRVVDNYGNIYWANAEDAKAGKKLYQADGNPAKIAENYHICYRGEAELTRFLKALSRTEDRTFDYPNGVWTLRTDINLEENALFILENTKDYLSGDISEIKQCCSNYEGHSIKLCYGIQTNQEGKKYQSVATHPDLILRGDDGTATINRARDQYIKSKNGGFFSNVEYDFCELKEYEIAPTNLEEAPAPVEAPVDDEMPWD